MKKECGVKPVFSCNFCDYRTAHKSTLRSHLVFVHNVDRSQLDTFEAADKFITNPIFTVVLGIIIVNALNFSTKIRPLQPFKCEKCGQTHKVNDSLKKHLKYECGLDPSFPWNQCNYRAARKHTKKASRQRSCWRRSSLVCIQLSKEF